MTHLFPKDKSPLLELKVLQKVKVALSGDLWHLEPLIYTTRNLVCLVGIHTTYAMISIIHCGRAIGPRYRFRGLLIVQKAIRPSCSMDD